MIRHDQSAATNLELHSSIPSTWLWGLNGWNHKLNEDFIILNEKTLCFESSYPLFHHARWQNSPSPFLPRCSTKVLHGGGVLKCFFVWWKCLPKISSEVDTTLNFRIQLVNLQMIQLTSFRITQFFLLFYRRISSPKRTKKDFNWLCGSESPRSTKPEQMARVTKSASKAPLYLKAKTNGNMAIQEAQQKLRKIWVRLSKGKIHIIKWKIKQKWENIN